MFKKVNNIIFIILFLAVLFVPLLFTRWESGGVSQEENRNLAAFPALTVEGKLNPTFTGEFESWFKDHIGFRQDLIQANTSLMQNVFHRDLSTSDWKTGKTGDSIYATSAIISDFAHTNLRSEEQVAQIGQSYQTISNWLAEKGIPFYYVQCVDKHTIYPERFIASVKQIGDTSKTDQVLHYLQNETTVNAVYFKQPLLDAKTQHDVFSHWGDPTHWTDRGAYISYLYLMERLAEDASYTLPVLAESDYDISYTTNQGPGGASEETEVFTLKSPNAQKQEDISILGQWSSDHRHSVWKNPNAANDKRLLLMADSYFNNYLIDDIAESYSEVWLVWGDYTGSLPEIVALCDPDVVIYECAERVDRSQAICNLAQQLQNNG